MSPKTILNYRATIHTLLQHGVDLEILDRNVCDRVKGPPGGSPSPVAWDQPQLARFLGALTDEREAAMFWLLATTGLRKGELLGLKWADVDMDTGLATISRRVVRLGYGAGINVDTPKTRSGARNVRIPAPALAKLDTWRQKQIEQRTAAGPDRWIERGWVFTTRTGNHIEPRYLNRRLAQIIERVGLERIALHGLRHTFATILLMNQVSVKDVQEILGHSRPTVTLNLYWQSIPGAQERIAAKVVEFIVGDQEGNLEKAENNEGPRLLKDDARD